MKKLFLILAILLSVGSLHGQTTSNAKKIQGMPIPLPTSSNDGQTLTYDNTNKRFVYANLTRSILSIGAKCDGSTDDTTAINSAASTPGTWIFPQNSTCLTQGVSFGANLVNFVGQGATLKHSGGAANYLITDNGHNYIDISGFILDEGGVLQTTTNLFMIAFFNGGPHKIHHNIFRNTGTARPTIGVSYSEADYYFFNDNTVEGTITSFHVFNDSYANGPTVVIENNILIGSNTVAITHRNGSSGANILIAKNHIYSVGTDAGDGQCGDNSGQCGNGIVVTNNGSASVNVNDNIIHSVVFSCIRVSYAAQVNVHGGVCDASGENALYSEWPSSTGASGNIFSGVTVTNSMYGFSNTNITTVGSANPDVVNGNKFYNISGYAIHTENALVTNNEITVAAIGIEIGYGSVGYGNTLNSNSCTRCGAAIVVAQGLSSTPTNQIGMMQVQSPINSALPTVIASDGPSMLTVTNGVNNAGTFQLTLNSAATSGATYLLRGFWGQPGANGALCLASAASTTINCTGLATPSGSFVTNPATPTFAEKIYSSGTTFAYSVPSTVAFLSSLRIGTAIASASTIAPVAPITHITGTTTINTITAPTDFTKTLQGGCLDLIPDGLWSTGTSGNIAIATTGVVSKKLQLCYDPGTSKWYPSY